MAWTTGFNVIPGTLEEPRPGEQPHEFHRADRCPITFDVDANTAPPATAGMRGLEPRRCEEMAERHAWFVAPAAFVGM